MLYSSKAQRTSKRFSISVETMAMADLMAVGWDAADAYLVAFHKGFSKSEEEVTAAAEKVCQRPEFKKRMEEVNAKTKEDNAEASKKSTKEEDAFMEQSSKEYTLRQLIAARESQALGSPDWLKVNQQIIEVTQMKKDEIKEEDTTIHYFLPVRCYQCSLFMKENEKKAGKK